MGSLNMDALIWMCLYGCIEIHPYRDIIPDGIDGVVLFGGAACGVRVYGEV